MSLSNECPECGSQDFRILGEYPERDGDALDIECSHCGHKRTHPA